MIPNPQTEDQFVQNLVAMLKLRLEVAAETAPPELDLLSKMTFSQPGFAQLAAELLRDIPAAAASGQLGSCTYIVIVNNQGRVFCIKNVTQIECAGLNGVFDSTNTCKVPSWP